MFIDWCAPVVSTPFGGAKFKCRPYYSRTISLLRTEPKVFCSSIYKHVTPNGVRSVDSSETYDLEIGSHRANLAQETKYSETTQRIYNHCRER